jgi:hypothetical protein
LKWGFESIALDGYYDSLFDVVLLEPLRTQLLPAGDTTPYVAHTAVGTLPASPDSGMSWSFNLVVAPPFDDACGWFFISAVAADGDGTPRGDYVYTTAEDVAIDVFCDCLIMLPGDVNSSGSITSADIIGLINYVFKSGAHPVPCAEVGDVNCSTRVDAADIITLVNFVFKGGYPPCDVCSCVTCTWDC